jgi:hypothetical protein
MPIKPELRWFYPRNWPDISRRVRFERANGVCEGCRRPHGQIIRCLPDGRWFDGNAQTWRNNHGRPARWPDLVEAVHLRQTRVVLAAAHLDHNPQNNRMRNLKSLCQRCHLIHDRSHHMARRRITYLLRRAIGDLFFGLYSACSVLEEARKPRQIEAEGHNGRPSVTLVGQRAQARRFTASFGAMGLNRAVQQGLWLDMP